MIELIRYDVHDISTIRAASGNTPIQAVKSSATPVGGASKKMWVEKFNGTGEVTIEGPIGADLFGQLPRGCLVSHVGTRELMKIHSHLISGERRGEPMAKVVGSQLISVIGGRRYQDDTIPAYPMYQEIPEQSLSIGNTELNSTGSATTTMSPKTIVRGLLINALSGPGRYNLMDLYNFLVRFIDYPSDATDENKYVDAKKYVDTVEVSPEDSLFGIIEPILKEFDIGVQIFRSFYDQGLLSNYPLILVHGGADRTGDDGVHLKVGNDSIKKYSSLQSDKDRHNMAIVKTSNYRFRIDDETITNGSDTPFDIDIATIDASHVDAEYEDIEQANAKLTDIMQKAHKYAVSELKKLNKDRLIVEVDISSDNPEYEYRKHFNLGDVVSIDSSAFFNPQPMRVIEFVESEEFGRFESYPVLKGVNDGWEFNAHTTDIWNEFLGEG